MHAPKLLHSLERSQRKTGNKINELIATPREKKHDVPLNQIHSSLEIDFSINPNLLLSFEVPTPSMETPKAGLLINQDHSCWVTNLGPDGFTEVYRFSGSVHRVLDYNQVAYVRQGDFVAFGGKLFRLLFGFSTIQLKVIQADVATAQRLQ